MPALCSCHIRIVRGALLSVRLFSSFVKTATAGAGFAVLLHPHPSHIQKHIPACPNQEFDMFDQYLSSGALGWHPASPQAAMSQARFSCLAAERRGER